MYTKEERPVNPYTAFANILSFPIIIFHFIK